MGQRFDYVEGIERLAELVKDYYGPVGPPAERVMKLAAQAREDLEHEQRAASEAVKRRSKR